MKALDDPWDRNRAEAALAIGEIFQTGQGREEMAAAAAVLAQRMKDPASSVRARSAFALAWTGVPQAAPLLSEALADPSSEVRAGAARAVGVMVQRNRSAELASAVLPALVKALQDEDRMTRLWAAQALGGFGRAGEPALNALRAVSDDPEPVVRRAADQAITSIIRAQSRE